MSRCGNCHDNAVAESFFQLLKREKDLRNGSDIFYYIEIFYNSKRLHGSSNKMPPA
ncbi:integrase core domain protein [Escherichia coli 2-011-08_S1_C3]|nr:integrase core domain protein [Escherichia coli 2-011-08_S1_C3]